MIKKRFLIFGITILIAACSNTQQSHEQNESIQTTLPLTSSKNEPIAVPPENENSLNEQWTVMKKGELGIDNIQVEDLDDEIVDVMIAFLKAAKDQDQHEAEKLFHPEALKGHLHGFYVDAPQKSVTKLYPNPDKREKGVAEEYGFDLENVKIVVADCGEAGSANFIIVKDNGEWSLYKTD